MENEKDDADSKKEMVKGVAVENDSKRSVKDKEVRVGIKDWLVCFLHYNIPLVCEYKDKLVLSLNFSCLKVTLFTPHSSTSMKPNFNLRDLRRKQ